MKTKRPAKPVKPAKQSTKRFSPDNPFGLPKRGEPPVRNPYAAERQARVSVLIAPTVARYFRPKAKKSGCSLDTYVTLLLAEIMHDKKGK